MPTGQTIINNALTILGILEQSGSPSASDSSAGLAELNSMWEAWGMDEGLIYAVTTASKALSTTVASYTIGTGATFNVARPARIYRAVYTLLNSRTPLEIVEAGRYYGHRDLSATAATPDELYPDWLPDPTTGFAKVYLWPVPTFSVGVPSLELDVGVNFAAWVLVTNYMIPPGFQDALQYALAFRLIPQYGGIVAPQVVQTVSALGEKAEVRIRTMNGKNRQLPPEIVALQPLNAPTGQQQGQGMTPRV